MRLPFKAVVVLLVMLPLWSGGAQAEQCPEASYTLSFQYQLDALGALGCTEITNDLRITSSSITNLDALRSIRSVGQNLFIDGTAAPNLDGLANLSYLAGALWIDDNPNLLNVDGLQQLSSLWGLAIRRNTSLFNLNGLRNVITVQNYVAVLGNSALANLNGLSSLVSIGSFLEITDNSLLNSISGLSNLNSLGSLYIVGNAALASLDGLSGVKRVDQLYVVNNSSLSHVTGLSGLVFVGEAGLTLTGNSRLTACQGLGLVLGAPETDAEGVFGDISIEGNAEGCNSKAQIMDSYWSQPGRCRTYGDSGAYVQKIFVSYLGRPAAPGGLEYFANYLNNNNEQGKLILFDDLYYSSESEGLFGNATIEAQINQFYRNMFSRNARSGGLSYWLNQIAGGYFTLPAAAAYIADAASGPDMDVLDAKQVAASKLTCAIGSDSDKLSGFGSNLNAARDSLAKVYTAVHAELYDGEAELAKIMASGGSTVVSQSSSSGSDASTSDGSSSGGSTSFSPGTVDASGGDAAAGSGADSSGSGSGTSGAVDDGASGGSGGDSSSGTSSDTGSYCAGYDGRETDCDPAVNFDPWAFGKGEEAYVIANRLTKSVPFTLPSRSDAGQVRYGMLQLTTSESRREPADEDIFHMWFSTTPNGSPIEGKECEWYTTQARGYVYWTQDESLKSEMCFLGSYSRVLYVNFETRCYAPFYNGTCDDWNKRKSSRSYYFDVARKIKSY